MNHNCKYIIIFKWIITVNISFVENESSNITYHNIKTNLIIKYIEMNKWVFKINISQNKNESVLDNISNQINESKL